jgi:hypothetical protein
MMRVRPELACVALAVTIVACGPTPPQAPYPEAKKLDSATSGISTTCGLSSQVTAFPPADRKDLITLDAVATEDARKLARVYNKNPSWIYQGETVRQIVKDSLTALHACGLHGAAETLRSRTSQT